MFHVVVVADGRRSAREPHGRPAEPILSPSAGAANQFSLLQPPFPPDVFPPLAAAHDHQAHTHEERAANADDQPDNDPPHVSGGSEELRFALRADEAVTGAAATAAGTSIGGRRGRRPPLRPLLPHLGQTVVVVDGERGRGRGSRRAPDPGKSGPPARAAADGARQLHRDATTIIMITLSAKIHLALVRVVLEAVDVTGHADKAR